MLDFSGDKVAFKSFIGHLWINKSLLDFLSGRFTYFSQDQWKLFIANKDVFLNGQECSGQETLKAGDEVRYMALKRPEPKVPTTIPVLFEDEDLLIVNKPPHIPVHPGGRYLRNTLIHLLQQQRKISNLFLAHRLDRETSGVCVLTKSHLGKEKMYWQFFKHEIEKTYWALCWGTPNPKSKTVDAPIGDAFGAGSQIRIKKCVGGKDAKSAKTKFHTLSTSLIQAPEWTPPPWPVLGSKKEGPWPISLVECKPITGRTNQIRVHIGELGTGLVGDKLYDPDESIFLEMRDTPPVLVDPQNRKEKESPVGFMNLSARLQRRLILDAHALHAKSLVFRHPRSSKKIEISAPPPNTWRGLYEVP